MNEKHDDLYCGSDEAREAQFREQLETRMQQARMDIVAMANDHYGPPNFYSGQNQSDTEIIASALGISVQDTWDLRKRVLVRGKDEGALVSDLMAEVTKLGICEHGVAVENGYGVLSVKTACDAETFLEILLTDPEDGLLDAIIGEYECIGVCYFTGNILLPPRIKVDVWVHRKPEEVETDQGIQTRIFVKLEHLVSFPFDCVPAMIRSLQKHNQKGKTTTTNPPSPD
jgi:hypothetical protein